jgi:hypothetical protein
MKARVRVFKILAGIAVLMFVTGAVAHAGARGTMRRARCGHAYNRLTEGFDTT